MYCKYNTYENTITKKGKGSKVTKFQIVFFYTYMYMHCRHHHAGVLVIQCDLSYENAYFINH